jgi:hypothetical protein
MIELKNKINTFTVSFEQKKCENGTVINYVHISDIRRNLKILEEQLFWANSYKFDVRIQFCAIDAYSSEWQKVYDEIKGLIKT